MPTDKEVLAYFKEFEKLVEETVELNEASRQLYKTITSLTSVGFTFDEALRIINTLAKK